MKTRNLFALVITLLLSVSAQAQNTSTISEFYPGGEPAMLEFIQSNLNYPALAKRNRIQGTVIVDVKLDADGNITYNKATIMTNGDKPRGGLGEEAQRIVSLLKFDAPGFGVKGNVNVKFKL